MENQIEKEKAFEFAKWIGERKYTKHQLNDRWYDKERDYEYIGSTSELFDMFLSDTDWQEWRKEMQSQLDYKI